MANVKITELTALTNPASSDVLPIVDVGADTTKKVTIADLLENAGDGSAAAPGIAFDGDSNTGIYRPGADQFAISTGGSEAARIDSDGRLLIGTTNATDNIRTHHKLAIVYAGNNTYTGAGFTGYSGISAAAAPFLEIQRSRGTTDGDLTRVNNGDRLGSLNFRGADGTNFITAANIACEVDNVASTNDMPGRLVFAVTANGASSTTEALRITNDRYVRLASGSGGIQFNGDTAAVNALDDYEEGTWTPALNWNNVTYTLQQGKYTRIGNRVFFNINLVWSANDASNVTSISLPFASTSANERATISVQDKGIPGNFQYPVADIFANTVFVRYVNTSGAYITNYGVVANDAGRIAITGNYAVS